MRKKQFSAEKIVAVLKQAELEMPVADIIRRGEYCEAEVYRWKKQYRGLKSG